MAKTDMAPLSVVFLSKGKRVRQLDTLELRPDDLQPAAGRQTIGRAIRIEVPAAADGELEVDAIQLRKGGKIGGVCRLTMPVRVGGAIRAEFGAYTLLF